MLLLFYEEDDDDWEMLEVVHCTKRIKKSEEDALYRNRIAQGYFNLLIKGHLENDDERFRQFLRLNRSQFHFVLNLISEDLKTMSTTTHKTPISPEEKLAVTLR